MHARKVGGRLTESERLIVGNKMPSADTQWRCDPAQFCDYILQLCVCGESRRGETGPMAAYFDSSSRQSSHIKRRFWKTRQLGQFDQTREVEIPFQRGRVLVMSKPSGESSCAVGRQLKLHRFHPYR